MDGIELIRRYSISMSSTFLACCIAGLAVLYLYHVNRGMEELPEEAHRLSPRRWTVDEIKEAYKKAMQSPVDVSKSLPPKQHRRYIVVGGTGLVGNWVVTHLLARGEDPTAIRILDLRPPRQQILDQGVTYVQTNITDEKAVLAAFSQPWPQNVANLPLTVFHIAAAMRPGERHKAFLHRCTDINVGGTRNVLNAAKRYGASCFVSTSSGSIGIHRPSYWTAPWTKWPKRIVQVLSDSAPLPKEKNQFFGNYAVSKAEAESIVRAADDLDSNFRTGCVRPTNGIYGIGDDASTILPGICLRTGGTPSWLYPVIQSFANAENVSIAHLLYEQRLIEHTNSPSSLPNIGGQAFVITDPNPAIAFSDLYLLLTTLSKTPVRFPRVPPAPFLLLSHLVEFYVLLQHLYLPRLLPELTGDLVKLQPSLLAVSNAHIFADDSRARRAPAQGGLGYNAPLTTLQALCKQLVLWNRGDLSCAGEEGF